MWFVDFNGLETGRLWRCIANYAERGLLIDKVFFFDFYLKA
jgi:hypothetical protein